MTILAKTVELRSSSTQLQRTLPENRYLKGEYFINGISIENITRNQRLLLFLLCCISALKILASYEHSFSCHKVVTMLVLSVINMSHCVLLIYNCSRHPWYILDQYLKAFSVFQIKSFANLLASVQNGQLTSQL